MSVRTSEAELREAAGHLYEVIKTAGEQSRILPWHIRDRYRRLVAALTQDSHDLFADPTHYAAFAPDRSSAWTELQFEPDDIPHFIVMHEERDDAELASDQLSNLDLARGNISPSFDADHDDREQHMRLASAIRQERKRLWASYKEGQRERPDWELLTSRAVAHELQARGVAGADGNPISPQQIRQWVKSTPKVTLTEKRRADWERRNYGDVSASGSALSDKRRKDAERRGVAYTEQPGADQVLVYPRDPESLLWEAEDRGYAQPPSRSSLYDYDQVVYADNHDRRRWLLAAFADEFHFGDTVAAMGVLDSGDRYGSPQDELLPRNGQLTFVNDDRDPMAIGIAADQHQRLERHRILAAVHSIGIRELTLWKKGMLDLAVHPVIGLWISNAHQVLRNAVAESERRALQAKEIKEALERGEDWEPPWIDRRVKVRVPAGASIRDHMNWLHNFAAPFEHHGDPDREMPRDFQPLIPEKFEASAWRPIYTRDREEHERKQALRELRFVHTISRWTMQIHDELATTFRFTDLAWAPEPPPPPIRSMFNRPPVGNDDGKANRRMRHLRWKRAFSAWQEAFIAS